MVVMKRELRRASEIFIMNDVYIDPAERLCCRIEGEM